MPNRMICDVLREMRECTKTQNYSYLNGLIEEAQTMASRMEAALWDQKEYKRMVTRKKKLKKKIKELQKKAGKDDEELFY